ncbi:MAG: hypothetical protein H6813_03055 [Phycisphaeraceae bacterium]|nr:hypothetical protein [Phycisphaeraceae bacterium]MCB9848704.1 hypothetical protein [Phycisphaeraceae bacterium]
MRINTAAIRHAALLLGGAATLLSIPNAALAQGDTPGLPERWLGRWVGESRSVRPGAEPMVFHTEILIEPIADPPQGREGSVSWTLIYGQGETRQIRPYTLLVVDADAGAYVMDEQNSILLPMTMLDGALHGVFVVGGMEFVCSERLRQGETPGDDELEMQIIIYNPESWEESGGVGMVPLVRSGAAVSSQRGSLHRAAIDAVLTAEIRRVREERDRQRADQAAGDGGDGDGQQQADPG